MTNKCKECGGTLVFDPDIQMLVCEHCTAMVPIEETTKEHAYDDSVPEQFGATLDELMDVKVYDCKNCGAELMLNDVEAATYCAYCGQPTVVFSRIEKRKRPKYIIPFQITKNQAISNIREKIFKSEYTEDQIKYFKPELLRGIYVPYGLFCYECNDTALLHGTPVDTNGEARPAQYYFRKVTSRIGHVPVDASYHLANDSADRLEPFFGKDLVEFDEGYLSGYYADLRDEDFSLLRSKATARAMDMFLGRLRSIPFVEQVTITKNNPTCTCIREDYALLPVYFMIFEDEGERYTILVNGQTGKVVGAVPTSFRTFLKWFLVCAFFLSLIATGLSVFATFSLYYTILPPIISMIASPIFIYRGIRNIKRYNQSMKLTTAQSMQAFASERQDI